MIPALRWAAMRAIIFNVFNVSVVSDGQSHKTVSTNHNLFEEKGESKRYWTEVLLLNVSVPLGQTGSQVRRQERRIKEESRDSRGWGGDGGVGGGGGGVRRSTLQGSSLQGEGWPLSRGVLLHLQQLENNLRAWYSHLRSGGAHLSIGGVGQKVGGGVFGGRGLSPVAHPDHVKQRRALEHRSAMLNDGVHNHNTRKHLFSSSLTYTSSLAFTTVSNVLKFGWEKYQR